MRQQGVVHHQTRVVAGGCDQLRLLSVRWCGCVDGCCVGACGCRGVLDGLSESTDTGPQVVSDCRGILAAQRLEIVFSARNAAMLDAPNDAIAGAGTAKRLPLQVIATRGAHDSALRKANPRAQP